MTVFNCNQCSETFTRKWNLEVHQKRKHHGIGGKGTNGINAPMGVYQPSGYSHIQTQTNPLQVVNAPLTGNFQHPPTYKHVQTQTVGDHPATYRDVGTQTYLEQRDLYTDSVASNYESEGSVTDFEFEPSSFENNVDINLSCLLGKLEETEKVLAHLFAEYKTQKHNWIKLIGKLGCFHEMNTSQRKQFKEVVDRAFELDKLVSEYNEDQLEESDDIESETQDVESKDQDIEVDDNEHGASCWGSFLDNLENGVKG